MQYKADKAVLHWPAELVGEPNEQEEGGSPFWGETGPAATDLREEREGQSRAKRGRSDKFERKGASAGGHYCGD